MLFCTKLCARVPYNSPPQERERPATVFQFMLPQRSHETLFKPQKMLKPETVFKFMLPQRSSETCCLSVFGIIRGSFF